LTDDDNALPKIRVDLLTMTRRLFPVAASILAVSFGGSAAGAIVSGQEPGFRVRSDISAPLNADSGWAAGAPGEMIGVYADQPFRLRLEAEASGEAAASQSLRLQYRRNEGAWTPVEAFDFPFPKRELERDFADARDRQPLAGWRVLSGDDNGLTVVAQGEDRFLRAAATNTPLVALFSPPWDLDQFKFGANFRLTPEASRQVALLFGYLDARNHGLVRLDAVKGSILISEVSNGVETVLATRQVSMATGEWLNIEMQLEDGHLEVNFQDDALVFKAPVATRLDAQRPGFLVPASSHLEVRSFFAEGDPKSPRVSIVSTPAYEAGAATTDLISGSNLPFLAGEGLNLGDQTSAWGGTRAHGEFEWPLVVRRYTDGAITNEHGDRFEFRMVDDADMVRTGSHPTLILSVPDGHLGGTFVETPGRLGPWQASNGDLYFIMEPAESSNLFMMMKSTDGGRSWSEVDGANRPATADLEAVDSRHLGNTIHILHQVTSTAHLHTFLTSDHPTRPDSWAVRDELAATVEAMVQMASMDIRSDGSAVAFYVGDTLHYSLRSAAGVWTTETRVDEAVDLHSLGPQVVRGSDDTLHIAYYTTDGALWYRRLLPDNTLTERQLLATGAGTTDSDYGAILPLVHLTQTDTVVIAYRLEDGRLWERRASRDGRLMPPVLITDMAVITNAVDSQQVAADIVADGDSLHVLFVDAATRSLFTARYDGVWQPARLEVDKILGSWVRGSVFTKPDGRRVYGYVYDAGSMGGAGMNRYGEIELGRP